MLAELEDVPGDIRLYQEVIDLVSRKACQLEIEVEVEIEFLELKTQAQEISLCCNLDTLLHDNPVLMTM